MNMCGTPCVVMVAPWVGAWANRNEAVTSIAVGQRPSAAAEIRIEGRVPAVTLVRVATGRVGLPDLDERRGHRPAALVQHTPLHDDSLTERFASVLPREVVVEGADRAMSKNRARELGEGVRY